MVIKKPKTLGKVKTYTITIIHDPRKPMSMEEYILWHLDQYGEAYVSDIFNALNQHRVEDLHKTKVKNTSFRAMIGEMAYDAHLRLKEKGKQHYPYIESITPKRKGFEPSAYTITPAGDERLKKLKLDGGIV